MRAMDIMTTEVISVAPTTSVQEVAKLLSERGISGVPVVDGDKRVVGILSEGDLLHRAETGTERVPQRRRSWWLESLASSQARDYVKSHARTARDVMTTDVVSIDETTPLADIAALLETKRIKRVPVLRDGKLVGIVSRANLVRAIAAAGLSEDTVRDDRAIRAKLMNELNRRAWAKLWASDIIVTDGVVHLWVGAERSPEELSALRVAAENVPGVRKVEEHLMPVPTFPMF
ncbi:MAG: CBS domain-containing protein [Alphaproteobacteria bacterium]|nr:CBS domain-containing protein [Alphaproteobacteria bacterium]